MVSEIRGPTQGGLSSLIKVDNSPQGVLSKNSKSASGIEAITEAAKQTNVVNIKEIQQANQNPEGIGRNLDVLGSYILPIIYFAGQLYTY